MAAQQTRQSKPKKEKERSVVGTRGRTFRGEVVKKIGKRAVVDSMRTVKIPKYERFAKKKTRLHARIPEGMEVHVGDFVRIRETRPLSKIVHFLVTDVLKEGGR